MPLYRRGSKLYYFAHVPKCGGQSVEAYLAKRWGQPAFLHNDFYDRAPHKKWSRSSPQHILWDDFKRLIPEDWIDASFAVVRHPLARLVSEYNFLVRARQVIPEGVGFVEWLSEMRQLMKRRPFSYDNHLRSQVEFVPEGARVTKLEDGLDRIVEIIDEISGQQAVGPGLSHHNRHAEFTDRKTIAREVDQRQANALIEAHYARDYERFDYQPYCDEPLTEHVPTEPPTVFRPIFDRSRQVRRIGRAMSRISKWHPAFGEY